MEPRVPGRPAPDLQGIAGEPHEDDPAAWLDRLVQSAAHAGCDAFQARAELEHRGMFMLEPRGRNVLSSRTGGLALTAYVGDASGFASTHDPSPEAIARLVARAVTLARANAARGGHGFGFAPGPARRALHKPAIRGHLREAGAAEAFPLLERAQKGATERDPGAIPISRIGYQDRRVLSTDSAGGWVDNGFYLSTLIVHSTHRDGARIGTGATLTSGERGIQDWEEQGGPEQRGRDAAERAIDYARAEPAPVGRMRVLCDHRLTGFLAHESFGHLAEFDLVDQGWSVLKGRVGETFAGPQVSVVDAPEVPGAPRTGVRTPLDDEGTQGRDVRILEGGVLKRYMHQRGSAAREGEAATGNGRALSVRHPPIVRMRNTFLEPGDLSVEEALEQLGDGVYLVGATGGAPASDGSYMFTAQRGWRVEGGELAAPIRSTSISGNILESLHRIEALTTDFDVFSDVWAGCFKWDQGFLPVGMGGPHMLLSEALVGGEQVVARKASAGA
ncbi:MAG TPA: TldD/PmbA family protein [Candidatus Thermoplasmatota archaeon]|jgi:TldD protein|nr:TldD/PmbA family protein [Candidatus Thermoplasmatota archaeon]